VCLGGVVDTWESMSLSRWRVIRVWWPRLFVGYWRHRSRFLCIGPPEACFSWKDRCSWFLLVVQLKTERFGCLNERGKVKDPHRGPTIRHSKEPAAVFLVSGLFVQHYVVVRIAMHGLARWSGGVGEGDFVVESQTDSIRFLTRPSGTRWMQCREGTVCIPLLTVEHRLGECIVSRFS